MIENKLVLLISLWFEKEHLNYYSARVIMMDIVPVITTNVNSSSSPSENISDKAIYTRILNADKRAILCAWMQRLIAEKRKQYKHLEVCVRINMP